MLQYVMEMVELCLAKIVKYFNLKVKGYMLVGVGNRKSNVMQSIDSHLTRIKGNE